jgi:phage-related protein
MDGNEPVPLKFGDAQQPYEYVPSVVALRGGARPCEDHGRAAKGRVGEPGFEVYQNFKMLLGEPPAWVAAHWGSGLSQSPEAIAHRYMPIAARRALGSELMTIQSGGEPSDFKPMPTIGVGAYEIRYRDARGAFRVVYVAKFTEVVYVLHAFQKKTQKTAKADIALAAQRYKLIGE